MMPRGKNGLPTVSRQFLTRNYPRPSCLLKCLPNCLSPTREGFFFFQNCPRGEGNCETIERQKLSRGNVFASRHQDASPGPLGTAVFRLAAGQLLVKMASALQKSQCCSATSAAQHSENCSAASVFACSMLQGWGLGGWSVHA